MKIVKEYEFDSCSQCPMIREARDMGASWDYCGEIWRTKTKMIDIANKNIIPDFCPLKIKDYQKTASVFMGRLKLLMNEFENVSIMSVADWVSEIEICDGKECVKTTLKQLQASLIIATNQEKEAEAERKRIEQEAEAQRLEDERIEAERIEREKAEQIKRDEQIAEDARIAEAKRAEVEIKKAKQDKIDADKKLEDLKIQNQKDADEAEAQRLRDIEAATENERQRVAKQKEDEKKEQQRREADKTHKKNINNQILAAILGETASKGVELTEKQVKAVMAAVVKGSVPHMTITY